MKSIIRLTTLSSPPPTPNPPTPKPSVSLPSYHSFKFSPLTHNSQPPIRRLFIVHPPPPPSPSANHHHHHNNNNNNNNGNNNNSNNGNNGNNENNGGDYDKGFEWPRWILWFVQRWFAPHPEYGWAVGFTGVATTASVNFCVEICVAMMEISLTLTLVAVGFTLVAACLIVSLVAFFFQF